MPKNSGYRSSPLFQKLLEYTLGQRCLLLATLADTMLTPADLNILKGIKKDGNAKKREKTNNNNDVSSPTLEQKLPVVVGNCFRWCSPHAWCESSRNGSNFWIYFYPFGCRGNPVTAAAAPAPAPAPALARARFPCRCRCWRFAFCVLHSQTLCQPHCSRTACGSNWHLCLTRRPQLSVITNAAP